MTIKELEEIFGNMRNFTKEENEYFYNKLKSKSMILKPRR